MQERLAMKTRLYFAVLASMSSGYLAAATAPAAPVAESAQLQPASASTATRSERVNSAAGLLTVRWFPELLSDLGLDVSAATASTGAAFRGHPGFALSADSRFEVDVQGTTVNGIAAGTGQIEGGFVLSGKSQQFDLRNLSYVVRAGVQPRIDLVNAQGRSYVYADKLMYELTADGRQLWIRSMDLVIGTALADALGRPELVGTTIAELHLQAALPSRAQYLAPAAAGNPNWPGETAPNGTDIYQADVFMQSITGVVGSCRNCDGPGGALDGELKITPSSTLANNVNNGTASATVIGDPLGTSTALFAADVPWYQKFTSSPVNNVNFEYPHPNFDQHPYLIWNLFKIDADGRLTQIGSSGVKHAFLTTNGGGNCDTSNGTHVLGRSCTDTYGSGNNDAPGDLGPRSELIPAKGMWGRCASIFDVDCDGNQNTVSGDAFRDRMLIRESALAGCRAAPNGDSRCWLESWYVIRDDINIYNTMATRGIMPAYTSSWSIGNVGDPFRLGSAVDRWVALTDPVVAAQVVELKTDEGRAKAALRVRDLGNGSYQYDYVVMNFDFARAVTTGIEADHTLRVLSNNGFNRFSIQLSPGVNVSAVVAADNDTDPANDWTATIGATEITWQAPANAASLNWGDLMRFSLIADALPTVDDVVVGVTEPSATQPASYALPLFRVGASDTLLRNGFE
jgi:hypothetical protein